MSKGDNYYFFSWNVNGYSPEIHYWLYSFAKDNSPDIIFLSETKLKEDDLKDYFNQFEDYDVIINPNKPWKYHGVVMLIRKCRKYNQTPVEMDIKPRYDTISDSVATGRIISILFEDKYHIVATYSPNSGNELKPEKMRYRMEEWDISLHKWLNEIRQKHPTVWLGDINVAISEKDVSNPEKMCKFAGFKNEERWSLLKFLGTDWIDVWRFQHPDEILYSWRGHYAYGNNKKYGMRLDNIIVNKDLIFKVTDSFMVSNCPYSDHVPICMKLN